MDIFILYFYQYLRGMDPVLKLYDSNGEMKEELRY
jgi:hypothetical protein